MKRRYILMLGAAALVIVLLAAGLAVLRFRLQPAAPPPTERTVLSQVLPAGQVRMRWYWFEVIQPAREPLSGYQALGTGFLFPVIGTEVIETALRERESVGDGGAYFFPGNTPAAITYLPGRTGLRALHGFFEKDNTSTAPRAGPPSDVEGTITAARTDAAQHVLTVRSVTVPPHGTGPLRRHSGTSLLLKIDGELTIVSGTEAEPLTRYRGLAESAAIAADRQYQVRNPGDVSSVYILVNLTPVGVAVDVT